MEEPQEAKVEVEPKTEEDTTSPGEERESAPTATAEEAGPGEDTRDDEPEGSTTEGTEEETHPAPAGAREEEPPNTTELELTDMEAEEVGGASPTTQPLCWR